MRKKQVEQCKNEPQTKIIFTDIRTTLISNGMTCLAKKKGIKKS